MSQALLENKSHNFSLTIRQCRDIQCTTNMLFRFVLLQYSSPFRYVRFRERSLFLNIEDVYGTLAQLVNECH